MGIGRRAQGPIATPPGDYTVILRPEAVADMLAFLARLGFGAMAVDDGRSFVAGQRGQRVLGENVTLWDDGHDPAGLPLPFDYEGTPRGRLALIDGGVAGDIATDAYYAGKLSWPNNGHALPVTADFYAGPIPGNPFMAPGDKTVEEMIASTERGLLITHFHYTRAVHPLRVIVTGMTRDGTFLIERGEVTRRQHLVAVGLGKCDQALLNGVDHRPVSGVLFLHQNWPIFRLCRRDDHDDLPSRKG